MRRPRPDLHEHTLELRHVALALLVVAPAGQTLLVGDEAVVRAAGREGQDLLVALELLGGLGHVQLAQVVATPTH